MTELKSLLEQVQALPDITNETFQMSDRSSVTNIINMLLSKLPSDVHEAIVRDLYDDLSEPTGIDEIDDINERLAPVEEQS
jgi:hypothetical protein